MDSGNHTWYLTAKLVQRIAFPEQTIFLEMYEHVLTRS